MQINYWEFDPRAQANLLAGLMHQDQLVLSMFVEAIAELQSQFLDAIISGQPENRFSVRLKLIEALENASFQETEVIIVTLIFHLTKGQQKELWAFVLRGKATIPVEVALGFVQDSDNIPTFATLVANASIEDADAMLTLFNSSTSPLQFEWLEQILSMEPEWFSEIMSTLIQRRLTQAQELEARALLVDSILRCLSTEAIGEIVLAIVNTCPQ